MQTEHFVTQDNFVSAFDALAKDIHETAVQKGWWDRERNDGEIICLMHSELSECLEGLRHGNPASGHISDYKASEEELADCIIRIMDYGYARKWKVAEAILAKIEFNRNRPHKHGGKKF